MLLTRRRVVAAPSPSPPACPVKADKALFDGIHENAASVHSALNQPKQLEQCLQGNSAAANQLDPDGDRRPLHWAAARGNTKCVELLLHAGGDPCRRCNRPDGGAAGAAAPGGRCSAAGPTDEGWGRQGDSTALCGALARGRCGAVPPVCGLCSVNVPAGCPMRSLLCLRMPSLLSVSASTCPCTCTCCACCMCMPPPSLLVYEKRRQPPAPPGAAWAMAPRASCLSLLWGGRRGGRSRGRRGGRGRGRRGDRTRPQSPLPVPLRSSAPTSRPLPRRPERLAPATSTYLSVVRLRQEPYPITVPERIVIARTRD